MAELHFLFRVPDVIDGSDISLNCFSVSQNFSVNFLELNQLRLRVFGECFERIGE